VASSIRRVKSADRTLDILETLAASNEAVSASALASILGIPKSSLFHLIGTLMMRGYVEETEEGRYRPGPKLAEIARSAEGAPGLADLMAPILRDLSESINETTAFSVQRADEVEVLTTHVGRQALTFSLKANDLAPLYAVSAGKALLAQKPADWFDDYVRRVRFEQFTPNTIRSAARLIREIERARHEGVAYVDEEFTPGIVGMASAVRSQGQVVGAINVAMPSVRASAEMMAKVRRKLASAVRQAEDALALQHARMGTSTVEESDQRLSA